MRCQRCQGARKMYKIGSAYLMTNAGGVQVDCPLCLGTGIAPSNEEKLQAIEEHQKTLAETKNKKRDYKKEYAERKNKKEVA